MIIVDGTKQLIELGNEKKVLIINENEAKTIKKIYHYTKIDNLFSILGNNIFIANTTFNNDYENVFIQNNKEQLKLSFSISFSKELNNQTLWKKFANNMKGCCIEIVFDNEYQPLDLFDYTKLFGCYNDKIFICELEARKDNKILISNDLYQKREYEVNFDVKFQPVIIDNVNNNSEIMIKNESYINLNRIGKYVKKSAKNLNEVRYTLILRSTKKVEVPDFNKVLIPINYNSIKNIIIHLGDNISTNDRKKVANFLNELENDKVILGEKNE